MASDFRQRVLSHLEANGFGEEALFQQLQQVIEGKTIKQKKAANAKGELVVVSEEVTINPKDAARGLMIADALMGGSLGLTPKQIEQVNPTERMYGQYIPKRDSRIIATKALPVVNGGQSVTLQPTSAEVSSPEPHQVEGHLEGTVMDHAPSPSAATPMQQVGSLLLEAASTPDDPERPF